MHIYIIGNSGSGKSTLASKLSSMLRIPAYDIDDVHFEKKYTLKREREERIRLLKEIVLKKDWIIEGSQTGAWARDVAAHADIIVEVRIPRPTLITRVITRALKQIVKREKHNETVKGLYALCKFIWEYPNPKKHYRREYDALLAHAHGRRVVLRNRKEIDAFVRELNAQQH